MTVKKLTYYLNYAYQHINARFGLLVILFMVVPVLEVFHLLSTGQYVVQYLTFEEASTMAVICMYVLPIVLALQLNSYLFDKKEVDFVVSMPLSRKSLFWVNYTVGAVFIAAMLFLTTIVIGIVGALHPLLVIDSIILVRFFIILFVGYMFVYSVAYFSLMTTGHQLTAALLAFAMIFLLSKINMDININYAAPYAGTINGFIVRDGVASYDTTIAINDAIVTATPVYILINADTINPFQIMLTIGETIIYTGLAYIMFMKRKMEVAQTSYVKTTSHNIAKGVILFFPAYYLIRLLDGAAFFDFFILISLVMLYIISFVYDSVTDRARASLLKSSISFVAIFIIAFMYGTAISGIRWLITESSLFNNRYITQKDVNSITIQIPSKIHPSMEEITISEDKFVSIFFEKDWAYVNEESYGFSESIVTFNTNKGSYKYYMGYIEERERKIVAYLTSHISDLENKSTEELPFIIKKIVRLGSYDEFFSQEMIDKVIAILAEEKMSEKTIASYYHNIYMCQTSNLESRGYCLLRSGNDPLLSSLSFYEYVGGKRAVYRLSNGLSNEAYMKLVNLFNTHYINELIEVISELRNDTLSINIYILDTAIHNYYFNQNAPNEMDETMAKQMISDFSGWISQYQNKEFIVADYKKVAAISITYAGNKNDARKTATLILPADEELEELIKKYNFMTYRDEYGDDSYVYD